MLTIEMDNFDLGQICRSGQCFRMDQIGDDRYRVIAGDKYLELTQERGIVNFFVRKKISFSSGSGILIWIVITVNI